MKDSGSQWKCLKCDDFVVKNKKELLLHFLNFHEKIDTKGFSNSQIKSFEKKYENMFKSSNGFPFHKSIPMFQFQEQKWRVVENVEFKEIQKLSVLSFNVLFDLYDKDLIYTSKRIPLFIKNLMEISPDIVGLQEVTKPFLDELLSDKWVQETYFSSENGMCKTISPFGQLILTKYPLKELKIFKFSTYKNFLMGNLEIGKNQNLSISVIHLTSDKTPDYETKRFNQIKDLIEFTKDFENQLILGDFNYGDNETKNDDLLKSFDDCWKLLYPESQGFTFDPENNELANVTSIKKKQRRLDKILFKSKNLKLNDIKIIFKEKMDEKYFLSDHFGLLTEFSINE
jgi:poly(A) polymerase